MKKLFIRTAFWKNVTQSIQIVLGAFQFITMLARGVDAEALEVDPMANAYSGLAQILLAVANIWTKDENNDGIIDIAQLPDIPTTTKITTTIEEKPGQPAKISTEEEVVTKPPKE